MRTLYWLAITTVTLLGCGGASGPTITPALAVVAGAAQIDTVAQPLPQLIAVQVTDAKSAAPLANYPLNWIALNGGSVFAPNTPSGADGIARQRVTLGTGAGQQCFAARALDPNTGDVLVNVQACATAEPDTAYSIHLASHAVSVAAGDSIPVRWWYSDAYANAGAHCGGGYTDDQVSWTPNGPVSYRVSADTLWAIGIARGSGGILVDAHCIEHDPINGRNHEAVTVTVQ